MATIERAYEIQKQFGDSFFLFESVGEKGLILKFVWIQATAKKNEFNLAFGDVNDDGSFSDSSISNNNDAAEVISTVVKCVYEFIKTHPGSVIVIKPVDRKREILYNYVFRNRIKEIEKRFDVIGIIDSAKEKYDSTRFYQEFELTHIA